MAVGSRPLVPSRLAPGGLAQRAHGVRRQPRTVLGAYVALTKPRIIELLLITTIPTMVLAERGWPSLGLMVVTLVGGTLAAGGANAVNMYVDRDIDAVMQRTQDRPLVTGVIAPRHALVFATALEVAAFVVLWAGTNLLAGRARPLGHGVLRGRVHGVAEAHQSPQHRDRRAPPAPCRCSSAGRPSPDSLGWTPWVLFLAMFFWTPPHFWALAIRYADDYRAADVPMLPAVVPLREAARQMIGYTVALVVTTLVLVPVADLGWIYTTTAVVLGAMFLAGDRGPRPAADVGRQHEAVRVQHHVRHAAVRRADGRRPRPVVSAACRDRGNSVATGRDRLKSRPNRTCDDQHYRRPCARQPRRHDHARRLAWRARRSWSRC